MTDADRITRRTDRITRTLARIMAKPGDHRLWKKLLRTCGEIKPSADPCMTTSVDAAARQCARRHQRQLNKQGA